MKINGQHYRTIWLNQQNPKIVDIIDQRHLPHQFVIESVHNVQEAARAIKEMHVRGAPLIGATAAYGMYLATLEAQEKSNASLFLEASLELLQNTRPTAIDLFHALDRSRKVIFAETDPSNRIQAAIQVAEDIVQESIDSCRQIGEFGLPLIEAISKQKGGAPVNILTHCNAGWIACIDHGTATSPIYAAHDKGIPVQVWVDETRPRNQGARITAFELLEHGVPHTVIVDNLGGHLMQHGMVDMVIVGTDRTTAQGDVANKIGTYLKALAAHDNSVPFYVALPSSSIDWTINDGLKEIPIEERGSEEVKKIRGKAGNSIQEVLLTPADSPAINYGFDVTPARLVTGLITERGIATASEDGLLSLFPERKKEGVKR